MPLIPLPSILIESIVRAALLEDLGRAGDLNTDAIVPSDRTPAPSPTGVDLVSMDWLTQSVRALDIGVDHIS